MRHYSQLHWLPVNIINCHLTTKQANHAGKQEIKCEFLFCVIDGLGKLIRLSYSCFCGEPNTFYVMAFECHLLLFTLHLSTLCLASLKNYITQCGNKFADPCSLCTRHGNTELLSSHATFSSSNILSLATCVWQMTKRHGYLDVLNWTCF